MRYEGTRPSKVDSQKDVYVFALGIEELKLLHEMLLDIRKKTPDTFDTNRFLNRVRNMVKRTAEALANRDKKDA